MNGNEIDTARTSAARKGRRTRLLLAAGALVTALAVTGCTRTDLASQLGIAKTEFTQA